MMNNLVARLRRMVGQMHPGLEAAHVELLTEAADRIAALLEDRARFPDKPDMIGRMIEAHIGNLKLLKERAERDAIAAADRLAALEAERKWRPIETAPRDGTLILMADKESIEIGQWHDAVAVPNMRALYPAGWEDVRYDADHRFEPDGKQPTHWMPLPPAPEDGE